MRPDVKDFYENVGTEICKINDEDNTDFEKSVHYILEEQKLRTVVEADGGDGITEVHTPNKLIAYGAFGGRIDHTISAIHILAKFNKTSYKNLYP